jgi:hypothetical protein
VFAASSALHRRFRATVAQMLAVLQHVARLPAFVAQCLPPTVLHSDGFADFLAMHVEVRLRCRLRWAFSFRWPLSWWRRWWWW